MTTDPGWFARLERMMLKRGINTVFELALWIALFYVIIGVAYAMFHVELMGLLQHELNATFSIFADIAALVVMIALWPFLLMTSLVCGVAGCGMLY